MFHFTCDRSWFLTALRNLQLEFCRTSYLLFHAKITLGPNIYPTATWWHNKKLSCCWGKARRSSHFTRNTLDCDQSNYSSFSTTFLTSCGAKAQQTPSPCCASRHRAVSPTWPKIESGRLTVTPHLPWKFHANWFSGLLVMLLTKKLASRHRAVCPNWPKIESRRPMVTPHLPCEFGANRSSRFLVILLAKKQTNKDTKIQRNRSKTIPRPPMYRGRGSKFDPTGNSAIRFADPENTSPVLHTGVATGVYRYLYPQNQPK